MNGLREARLVIGIDAANLERAGGVTQLVELITDAKREKEGIATVGVWGGQQTLARLPERSWLDMIDPAALDRGLRWKVGWQRFRLSRKARQVGCYGCSSLVGSYAGDLRPAVTMSWNLRPFAWRELGRFSLSPTASKLVLQRRRRTQARCFRSSDGVIFVNEYAWDALQTATGRLSREAVIIPHGTGPRSSVSSRLQRPLADNSEVGPFRLMYMAVVDRYKRQWHVAKTVHILRWDGWRACLELVCRKCANLSGWGKP